MARMREEREVSAAVQEDYRLYVVTVEAGRRTSEGPYSFGNSTDAFRWISELPRAVVGASLYVGTELVAHSGDWL